VNSTPSPPRSMAVHVRHSVGRHRPKRSTSCYSHANNPVLRRPVELGQYTAIRYGQRLAESGIERSVGRKGDSYDNALAESVNALYKKEVITPDGPWNDASEVTLATAEWVSWYDRERLHSWCGDIPPLEFEDAFWQGRPAQHPTAA
jgi:transposase InsO family protein